MLPDAPEMPVRLFTPLSMVMEVAPLVAQLSIDEPPAGILDVERYRAAVGSEPVTGGGAAPPTDIDVLAKLLPAELVAVKLKVIVPIPVVFIARLPETGTAPKPAMLADVAFSVFQASVVAPPSVTLDGLAVKLSMVGRGPDAGGGVTGLVTTIMVERDAEFEPLVASSI